MDLEKLKEPMEYKWRVQSFSKHYASASCVAYIDARQDMDRLDEVCGADNWQDDYKDVGGRLLAGVGIKCDNEWIWKWDTGVESNVEKEKGEISDSFKRACVKWGLGRFLYAMDIVFVKSNAPKNAENKFPHVMDDSGRKVTDLTSHINSLMNKQQNQIEIKKLTKAQFKKRLEDAFNMFMEKGITGKFENYMNTEFGTAEITAIVKDFSESGETILAELAKLYKEG